MIRLRWLLLQGLLLGCFGVRLWFFVDSRPVAGYHINIEGTLDNDVKVYGKYYKYILNHIPILSKTPPKTLSIGDMLVVSGEVFTEQGLWGYQEVLLKESHVTIIREFESLNWQRQILYSPKAFLYQQIYSARDLLKSKVNIYFSGKERALVMGMVLGDQTKIDQVFYEELRNSGLLHVVVASGGNVVLVSMLLFSLLEKWISRGLRYWIGYLFIWSYAVLTGLEAPVLRAVIMISLIWLSLLLGRKTNSIWIIGIVCLVMLLMNPEMIYSVGFLLSFSATTGIVMFATRLEKLLKRLFNIIPLKELFEPLISLFAQTISAQILVVPLILSVFGTVSNYSVVANILVGLLIAPITSLGMIMLLIPEVVPGISRLISWGMVPMLHVFIKVIEAFGSGDNSLILLTLNPWWVVGWWAIIWYIYLYKW